MEEKNKDITDSINYSKRIQTAVLPSVKKWKSCFPDSFIVYLPKEIVSGDFYWLELKGNRIYFAVGDCKGHGVPGALISFICSGALSESVLEINYSNTDKILRNANKIIRKKLPNDEKIQEGMDICLICLDKESRKLEFCCAGISFFYFTTYLNEIKPDKVSVGFNEYDFPLTVHELKAEPIKYIYVTTDGYYIQSSSDDPNITFGKENFLKLLKQCSEMPLKDQENKVVEVFTEWKKNSEQTDDVTLTGIKLNF